MTPIQALVVLGFALILVVIAYEIGRKSAEKSFSAEIDTFRRAVEADLHRHQADYVQEVRYNAYCLGVQDADNWWIRQEEEIEKIEHIKQAS